MRLKNILFISLLLCVICALQVAAAMDIDMDSADNVSLATDGVVLGSNNLSSYSSSENDSVLTAGEESFTALNQVINGGSSTISLTKDYKFNNETDSAFADGITISKPLVIIGNGHKIDGSNLARIFTVNSRVILLNVTFVNANSSGAGGAIYITGDDGTLTDVTFENNTANGSGGALFIEGSNWRINNAIFNNNVAYGDGGAIYINGEEDIISNSNFENNHAISTNANNGFGGAVSLSGPYAVIEYSTFNKNNATLNGGAVVVKNANSNVRSDNATILNCTFTYNVAGRNGGAICWNSGCYNGTVINCTIEHNIARGSAGGIGWQSDNGTIWNTTFRYNNATGEFGAQNPGNGGGLTFTGSNSYVYNSTFESNYANTHGGAVFLRSNQNTLTPSNNTWFIGCNFINNTAGVNGGAVDWYKGATNGHIINGTFTNNTARRSGGAVFWFGKNGEIKGSNFTDNRALGEVLYEDSFGNMTYGGHGGAVMWTGADGKVLDSTFTLNNASRNGGAIYMQGSTEGDCSNITVDGSKFVENYAGINGGALDWYEGAHDSTLSNSYFVNNTAERSGGAVYWYGHDGTIVNSTFTNNKALGLVNATDSYGNITPGGHGGAIIWTGLNGKVLNSNFTLNNASRNGGAIYMQGSKDSDCSNITVDGSRFIENYARVNGGALDWYEGAHNATLSNSILINNTAERSGGAVYWYGHDGTIVNSTFTNNKALGLVNATDSYGRVTPGGHGGAIIWTGLNGKILNSNFTLNNASRNGGAIFMQGSKEGNKTIDCSNITVDGSEFVENYAGINGGALDWYEGAHDSTLSNSNFVNNTAKRSGGAVYWYGHDGTIVNSTFENNKALGLENATDSYGRVTPGGHGGAIIWTGANGKVLNSNFTLNNASRNGGAIYMQGSEDGDCSNITVDGSRFIENYAGINGGALDWYEGAHDATLSNSVLINNTAKRSGGAVYWYGHDGTIVNSTFENNKALGLVNATDSYGRVTPGGHGGAIIWTGLNGKILNSNFTLNNASRNGGAIFMQGSKEGNKTIDCSNMTVDGSEFVENYAGINGGALDWYEGAHDSTLSNSNFVNNTAKRSGGAVYWYGHDGSIINSTFENNKALGLENATDSYGRVTPGGHGGAIIWTGANGKVLNSNFTLNNASRNGGAIYMQGSEDGDCSNITVDGSKFVENYAGINGGALDWYEGAHDATLSNSVLINNTAERSGGAVYWYGHDGTIVNSTFTNNKALGLVNATDSYGRVTPGGHGGAIMWTGLNGKVLNSNFTLNNASRNGGAIFMQGSIENGTLIDCSNMTVDGSEFVENYAGINGGALDWYEGAHDSTLSNSNFVNNSAERSGGAVYWYGHNGTIANSTFENNRALGEVLYNDSYNRETYGGHGGAVMWTGADGKVLNSTFTSNNASRNGGAIFMQGSTEGDCANITIDTCVFEDNYAGINGGAIDFYEGAHNGRISDSILTNNTAYRSGGAVFWFGEHGEIRNVTFTNNRALGNISANSSYGYNTTGGDGGAIMWTGSHGLVDNCTFENNTAKARGGAVFLQGSLDYGNCTNTTFSNCIFNNNSAGTNGGAIDWHEGATDGYVYNSSFTDNEAKAGNGGAIYWNGLGGDVINATFINNKATVKTYIDTDGKERYNKSTGNGGAIMWVGNQGYINNITCVNNTADKDGGVLSVSGDDCQLYNSTFTNNTACDDGGVANWDGNRGIIYNITCIDNKGISETNSTSKGGSICLTGNDTSIDQSTFKNSFAAYNGGAIFITGNNVNITNSDFRNCSSDVNKNASDDDQPYGGALYILGNYTFVDNCTFDECSAIDGGAVYISGNNATIAGSEFNNNNATGNGGVIYVLGSDATISGSDFTSNYAAGDGGVLNVIGDDCELANSTFTDNVAGDDGGLANWRGVRGIIYNITSVNNNGISEGTSHTKGGAICLNGDNATIDQSSFEGSNGAYNGGAIFITGNNVNITSTAFRNCSSDVNKAVSGDDEPYGGALNIVGNRTFVDNCTFDECSAIDGGAIYISGNNATIAGSNFTSNNATQDGGVIYVLGSDATISGSEFTNNYANGDGGVLNVIGDDCELANSTFTNNTAGDDGGLANWVGVRGIIYNITSVNSNGISRGTSHTKGGAICLNGDNATIDKSSFADSNGAYNGGAIFITGNNVNVTSTAFRNCSSDVNKAVSGDDLPYGGALNIVGNDAFVDNCTFDECSAIDGGAIYISGERATINHSNFTDINSTIYGGAIYVKGNDAVINGSDFTDIFAKDDGGAIYVNGRNTNVNASSFLDCISNDEGGAIYINNIGTNISHSNFTKSNAKAAGAIYINGQDTVIEYCNLDNNSATGSVGTGRAGAIYVTGDNTLLIYNNFTNNYARNVGGALDIGGENASVYYCSFDNNEAKSNGGAINWIGGHGSDSIVGSNFTNNTCYGGDKGGGAIYWSAGDTISSGGLIKDCIFIDNVAAVRHGGAIDWFRTMDSVIDNCTFIRNIAFSDGGALYTGDQNGGSSNITISNSKFYNNTAKKHGGAIANQMSYAYIVNNTFDGNMANSSGGTILIKESSGQYSVIDHCNITNSYVNQPINVQYGEGGGAIRIGFAGRTGDNNITISNCIIINASTGSSYGGAITIQSENCTIENVTIINSSSKNHQGGAIHWTGNNGKINNVNITNSSTHTTGTRNVANIDGGAIYWTGSNANLNNVTINNAYTNSTNTKDAHGGAIYIKSSNVYMNNISVNNSYASAVNDNAYGGAIYLDGNNRYYITNASLSNNSAVKGGAIYGAGSQTRLSDSVLANNSAEEGGAMFLRGGGHVINNTSIVNNTATRGGGIYLSNTQSGDNLIIDSNITYNKAFQGSGIYIDGNSRLKLENDILLDNQAHSNKFINKFIELDEQTGNYTVGATFTGYDNLFNGIWLESGSISSVKNLTYWGMNGVRIANSVQTKRDQEIWQNVTVERYDEYGNLISRETVKTDENGAFRVNAGPGIDVKDSFRFYHIEDTYYTEISDTISNVSLVKVIADDIYIGQNTSITINLTDGAGKPLTGNVTFKLNITGFEEIEVEIINGTGYVNNITGLPLGKYNASAVFRPTTSYFGSSNWDTFNVLPIVHLNITKNAVPNPVDIGETVVFTINVTNVGPCNGTNVVINDTVPGQFNITGVTKVTVVTSSGKKEIDAKITNNEISVEIEELNVGEYAFFNITVTALVDGIWNNTASTHCSENLTEINSTATVVVNPVVNLDIIKKSNLTGNAKVGDLVNFTIEIINNGPSNATGLNVSDVLNDTFEFVGSDGIYNNITHQVTWNIDRLGNHSSIPVWVTVRVLSNGTFVNVATVNCNENTTNVSNKTTIVVDHYVNLTLVKVSNLTENAKVHDLINFTINITNNGLSNATGLNVSDVLDGAFEFVDSDGSYDNVTREITWNINHLDNGSSVSVWVVVRALTNGTFVNVATVNCNENTTKVSNKTNVTVDPVVNFTLVKISNATLEDNATVGDLVNFTITVTNIGPSNATNVNITDVLDARFEYANSNGNYNNVTRTITWNIGKLSNGSSVSVWVIVKALRNGFVPNAAHVNSTENPNGTTNKTTAIIYPAVNITLTKVSNLTENAKVGDLVNFTIEIVNMGPSNATNVNITDVLDSAFEFVDSDGSFDNVTRVITWNIGDLDYGNSTSVWVVAKFLTNGTFVNVASVNSTENKTGTSNKTNVTADPVVNLTLIKSSNLTGNASVGDLVNFTISITNNGLSNATGVNVSDVLDGAFEFVGSDGSYDNVTREITWSIDKLENGTSTTVWVAVKILTNGTFVNVATVNCNENTTEVSNRTNVTVDPVVNLTLVKVSNLTENAKVHDLINFTINITNNGLSNATGLNVSDVLDGAFEFVGSDGSYDNVTREITWNINHLDNGSSVSVWVAVRALTNGTFVNVATVNCNENTTKVSNRTNVTVDPVVNFTLVKISNATVDDNATVGDLVNFTITVTNIGPSNATNVNITDVLDARFEYANSNGNYNNITRTITWNIGKLSNGSSVSVWVIVKALRNGFLPNAAHVNSTENPNGTTNKTTAIIYPAVNITLTKMSNLTENAKVGDLVNFTIEIVNMGPSNATNVNITDVLDNAFEFVDSDGSFDNVTRVITWNIGDLDYGNSTSVWVVAKFLTNGTFVNIASVNSTENKTGTSNKTNVTADPVVNLTLVKVSNVTGNAKVGDLVNFTIAVTNLGPSNATNVNISDVLNETFEFIDSYGSYDIITHEVTWNINKLENGTSVSVWVVVKVLTNGTFENVASVVSTENPNSTSNRTNVTVDPVVNLTLVKVSNVTGNAKVHDLINFTINITNLGPSNATGVNVSDILDSAFEFVDSDGSYDNVTREITWNINKLENGISTSVWVVVRALTNGTFVNVASVVSTENPNSTSNRTNVTVDPVVNLTLVKVSNVTGNAKVGDLVNFTITVTNLGPSNATGLNVSDILDNAFEFVDSDGSFDNVTREITWNINKLENGISTSVWVVVRALTNGTFVNVASVVSTENPNSTSNRTNVTVDPVVNLTLVKVSNVTGNAKVGDLVNFTITVTNLGPSNATGVNVSDILDSAFEFVDSDGSYDNVTCEITWNINKLENGISTSVWVVVRALTNGTFVNVASVVSTENPNSTSNRTNVTVDPVVNLTLVKVSNVTGNAKVGDLVNFTITVTNLGPSNATGVNVSDILDSAFEFVDSDGSYDNVTCEITWNINKLENGTGTSVWVVVRALTNGTFVNVASVVSTENPNSTSNRTNVTVDPVVNLTLVKVSNVTGNAKVGDLVNFTITVTNLGPSNATGLNVSDILDNAFEFVDSDGSYDNVTCEITWNINKLENGTGTSVWVVVRALTNGTFVNVASVVSTENPNSTSNRTNVTVDPVVNLTLVKVSNVTGNAKVGDLVNFTITVTNLGPSNATGLNVSDILDNAFEFVDSDGSFDNVTCEITWSINKLENGSSVSVWVVVKVLTNGTFVNVATVTSTENKTGTSNKTNVTVDPVVNFTLVKVSNATVDDNASVGDLVNFTITVTNVGPSNATDVIISDVLDARFEYAGSNGNYNNVTHEVTWNIAKLSNGSSVSVWVIARALTNGFLPNAAHVNSTENPNGTTNKTTAIIYPAVNITLVKVSNATLDDNATVGDLVNFTITITNHGPSNATNVNITDVLNEAFEYVDSKGSYDNVTRMVTWNIGNLNNGSSVSVWVVVRALSNGFLQNTAKVNSTENKTGHENGTTVVIYPAVNITLVKVSNLTGNAKVGDLVNFTITITNHGPSNATNVNVSDILDSAFEFVDSNGSYDDVAREVTWNVNKLENGSSVSVWVVVKVLTNGTFENVATVTSSENKTGTSNRTNVTVDPVVNLTLVKSSNVTGNARVGDLVNFTITITNHGPSNATGLNVSDILDSAFEFVDSDGSYDDVTRMVTWNVNKLENGSSVSVWVVVKVLTNGTFENAATVVSTENPNSTSNKTDVTVDPVVEFTLVKKSNVTNADVDDLVNFTITVTNVGPSNATGVNISDVLDDTFEFVDSNGNYNPASHEVTWNIKHLENGTSASVWVVVRVSTDGIFENIATVNSNENKTGTSNKTNITVGSVIDLEITVTVDKNETEYGSVVEFVITVKNNGPSNATGVVVKNIFDNGFEYVSDNITDSDYKTLRGLLLASSSSMQSFDQSTGTWYIGDLANGESVSLAILERVYYYGTRGLNSYVSGNEKEYDYTNNNDSAYVTVRGIVDLEITKEVDKTNIKEGENVTYTITVKNNGPNNATGVKVIDNEITQHKFVSSSSGDYDPETGVWLIGDLANGSGVTLSITVIIEKEGIYGNTAFVSSNENDTNISNNNVSSENVTVSKNKEPDKNETHNETAPEGAKVSPMYETGNPIFVLLLVVLAIGSTQIRRFKK